MQSITRLEKRRKKNKRQEGLVKEMQKDQDEERNDNDTQTERVGQLKEEKDRLPSRISTKKNY